MSPDVTSVSDLLADLGYRCARVRPVTGGAWSSAYAVDVGPRPLVLRLGGPAEDYRADAFVDRLAPDGVPVPAVLEHGTLARGPFTGTTYAISQRVPGAPLEEVGAATWNGLVPQLADILEALRHVPVPPGHPTLPWREHLLGVGSYAWQEGWRLRAEPVALEIFDRGLARLRELCPVEVPVSLVHADWINRNVHVDAGRITGVFDWGCYRFGDHLYDLTWFEFWSPWHPTLDVDSLTVALQRRWQDRGLDPLRDPGRRLACLLHIGLDHIVYNTLHGTHSGLRGTMDRLDGFL
ncbi:aminoglycoside phosphotransferase family protein [Ruania suaedae]|uniref:phosphotransferase family protein n=1 Tax=Ruania suaedae TaxID=2897774 RepID=UPI001E3F8A35|nr:aminoglycoside phosphotransferase family protein [Ruania suaedae]UFU04375.1 aminoglycoside phosphotransferase family protein [Ruania suaedae]